MSAYFDSAKGRWRFEFSKVINGTRVRATKLLPKGWSRSQAQAYSKAETDRLYENATNTGPKRHLISDAVDLYYRYRCPELKNGDGVKKELARLFAYYDGKYIDQLPAVAREYMNDERGELAPGSIKNKLSYIRSAINYAYEKHGFGNGTVSVAMPAVSNERQVYATRREMIMIARACKNRPSRAVLRLGFYTGMRLSEIISVGNESQITTRGILLPGKVVKNGATRLVPVHHKALSSLRQFPIGFKKRWIQTKIREAMDSVGLNNLVFHDIRHSTASSMINAGVDLYTIGKVLGHLDSRSTQRYSHLSVESMEAAILKIK
jgi:integrase